MAYFKRDSFTIAVCPKHMRAGAAVNRPAAILFDDEDNYAGVSELLLTLAEAEDLLHCLRAALDIDGREG